MCASQESPFGLSTAPLPLKASMTVDRHDSGNRTPSRRGVTPVAQGRHPTMSRLRGGMKRSDIEDSKWVVHNPLARAGAIIGLLVLVAVSVTACNQAAANPKIAKPAPTPSAVDDFNKAQNLSNAGVCARAIPVYLRALMKNRMYVNAYTGLGYCYQQIGSPNAAILEYDKAIQIDPTNWNLYYQRAGAEVVNGSRGAALTDYLYALKMAPPQAPSYATIAQALHDELNDYARAVMAVDKAIAVAPGNPNYYIQRAGYYLDEGNLTHAYADYNQALKVAPFTASRANIEAQLAQVYQQQGDFDSAYKAMNEAIRLQPDNTHFYVLSGDLYRAGNHFTFALNRYNQALRVAHKGPDAEAAHEGKGDAYVGLGQTGPAIAEYQQAKKLTKDAGTLARLKAEIEAAKSSQS